MEPGKKVWAPDSNDGYVLSEIQDLGADGLEVKTEKGQVSVCLCA
jgi:hypothetical protein